MPCHLAMFQSLQKGFEPLTQWLTAICSTSELLKIIKKMKKLPL
tara:strand:- start:81 stop:212 length:132 start_codon:yes stop_codon:yes gene_type:complete